MLRYIYCLMLVFIISHNCLAKEIEAAPTKTEETNVDLATKSVDENQNNDDEGEEEVLIKAPL